jgi:hypothetical protein
MKVNIETVGLKEVMTRFNTKVSRMKDLKDRLPRENAKMYRDMLVDNIRKQDFPGARIPLTMPYLKTKRRKGLDPRVHIATKDYIRHIRVFKARGANVYYVGPSPYASTRKNDLTYAELGLILEKQRPHLNPAFKRLRDRRGVKWRLIYNVYS